MDTEQIISNYRRADWKYRVLRDKQWPHTRTHAEKLARAGRALVRALKACAAAGININDIKC
jgi:hypothetical protein